MSHLNFWILPFSTNFCRIKTDLSGNTVWPQASAFQKLAKMDQFWHFWLTFVESKCTRSSLSSQCWMRLILWFSNTVPSVIFFFSIALLFARDLYLLFFLLLNCIFQKYVNPISDIAVEYIFWGDGGGDMYSNMLYYMYSRCCCWSENTLLCSSSTLGRDTICISHHNTSFLYSCIRIHASTILFWKVLPIGNTCKWI